MKKYLIILSLAFGLSACAAPATQPPPAVVDTPAGTQAGLPNPASVFCEEHGNRLEIRTAADGSQSGVCIFQDGSECDEWAYFRGECQPGQSLVTPAASEPAPTEVSDTASDGCKIYRNAELGYSFHYPADAEIVTNDDPLHGITVVGPEKDGERWPVISISHPADREDFRPPENGDLFQWLTDHNLLGEARKADIQIAGITAVHFRHERSPQSPADDRYYFARQGQLYLIIIGHTGGREDWPFYNHFLESFSFDPAAAAAVDPAPLPTAMPIDPAGYQGWWTYTHPVYIFSIMLPEDWVVDETTTFDPVVGGHTLQPAPRENG